MKNGALFVAGTIFLLVGLLHGARLMFAIAVTFADTVVPLWVSIPGCIVSLALAVWMFAVARKKCENKK